MVLRRRSNRQEKKPKARLRHILMFLSNQGMDVDVDDEAVDAHPAAGKKKLKLVKVCVPKGRPGGDG